MAAPASKAERTRRQVLEAAERHFARRGFQAARLEDIAREVGVRRAALFYHFRDKRALHDAVLAEALGSLLAHIQEVMARELPFAERAMQAAMAWGDLEATRPDRAQLLRREAASGEVDWRRLVPIAAPFLEWMRHELSAAAARHEIDPVADDPRVLLGALAGAGALPATAEGPLAARHRTLARVMHRLLGTG